jgi:hypothetical protein
MHCLSAEGAAVAGEPATPLLNSHVAPWLAEPNGAKRAPLGLANPPKVTTAAALTLPLPICTAPVLPSVPPTFRLLPLSPDAVNAEFLDRSEIEDTPLPRGADTRAGGGVVQFLGQYAVHGASADTPSRRQRAMMTTLRNKFATQLWDRATPR